jgi:hypothetical protein
MSNNIQLITSNEENLTIINLPIDKAIYLLETIKNDGKFNYWKYLESQKDIKTTYIDTDYVSDEWVDDMKEKYKLDFSTEVGTIDYNGNKNYYIDHYGLSIYNHFESGYNDIFTEKLTKLGEELLKSLTNKNLSNIKNKLKNII